MTTRISKGIPVVEGLFTWPSDKPQLIGTRCLSCGSYFFPKTVSCSNPDCEEKKVEDVLLSRGGKLFSYTIQHYPPPPPSKFCEPFAPYGIGFVELPEGIRVVGRLTTADASKLRIGMDVELTVEKVSEDDKGNELVTYKFKPSKQERRSK